VAIGPKNLDVLNMLYGRKTVIVAITETVAIVRLQYRTPCDFIISVRWVLSAVCRSVS